MYKIIVSHQSLLIPRSKLKLDSLGEHLAHPRLLANRSLHRNAVEMDQRGDAVRHDGAFLRFDSLQDADLWWCGREEGVSADARTTAEREGKSERELTFKGLPQPSISRSNSPLNLFSSSSPCSPAPKLTSTPSFSFFQVLTLPTHLPSSLTPKRLSNHSLSPAIV